MERKWTFTGEALNILDHYLEGWRNGDRPKRVEVGGKAWEEVKNLNGSLTKNEKSKREKRKVSIYSPPIYFYRRSKSGSMYMAGNVYRRKSSNTAKDGTVD